MLRGLANLFAWTFLTACHCDKYFEIKLYLRNSKPQSEVGISRGQMEEHSKCASPRNPGSSKKQSPRKCLNFCFRFQFFFLCLSDGSQQIFRRQPLSIMILMEGNLKYKINNSCLAWIQENMMNEFFSSKHSSFFLPFLPRCLVFRGMASKLLGIKRATAEGERSKNLVVTPEYCARLDGYGKCSDEMQWAISHGLWECFRLFNQAGEEGFFVLERLI